MNIEPPHKRAREFVREKLEVKVGKRAPADVKPSNTASHVSKL